MMETRDLAGGLTLMLQTRTEEKRDRVRQMLDFYIDMILGLNPLIWPFPCIGAAFPALAEGCYGFVSQYVQ